MSRIIVVEDEYSLRVDLVEYLISQGYDAIGADSFAEMNRLLFLGKADVAVLDVNLPDADGFSIAKHLRTESNMGIIMLTCRSSLEDRIEGLDCGADAYLVKHADLREIEATIRSLLRRMNMEPDSRQDDPAPSSDTATQPVWHFDSVEWSLVSPNGTFVRLTSTESAFIAALLKNPGMPCPRDEISKILCRPVRDDVDRSLDAVVRRLRRKVERETGLDLPISVVYGVGYAFSARATLRD